jgi:hypothetical protein
MPKGGKADGMSPSTKDILVADSGIGLKPFRGM